MKVDGKQYRTVWANELDGPLVKIINQTKLPFSFEIENLVELNDVINAIKEMHVRGAGCIGVTAAYGMWLAVRESGQDFSKYRALADRLLASRPTAKNLSWAVERQLKLYATRHTFASNYYIQTKDVKGGAKALGTTVGTFNKYSKVLEDQVVDGIDAIEFDEVAITKLREVK